MANDANSRRADRQVKNLFVNAHQISLRFELLFGDGLNTVRATRESWSIN